MGTDYPVTQAIRVLRAKNIPFTPRLYDYEEHGGTARSSRELGVPEHGVIKTLVLERDDGRPLICLMHGDREISLKELARILKVKRVAPCSPEKASKHTGYLVGGTSPFGTRSALPVYVERTIFALDRIYINGGKRGLLVEIDPKDLHKALAITEVEVATGK